jgi:hypothetical protein
VRDGHGRGSNVAVLIMSEEEQPACRVKWVGATVGPCKGERNQISQVSICWCLLELGNLSTTPTCGLASTSIQRSFTQGPPQ